MARGKWRSVRVKKGYDSKYIKEPTLYLLHPRI